MNFQLYKFIRQQLNVSYFDLCDQSKCKTIVELVTSSPRKFDYATEVDVSEVIECIRRDMEP